MRNRILFPKATSNFRLGVSLLLSVAFTVNFVVLHYFQETLTFDEFIQIGSGKMLSLGFPLGIPVSNLSDSGFLSLGLRPLDGWPQGVSLLFALLFKITSHVWFLYLVLMGFGAFLFIWTFFEIAHRLDLSFRVSVAIVAIWWLGFSPIDLGGVSDVLCLGLFSLSCLFLMEWKSRTGIVQKGWLIVGICLAVIWCCLMRYAYYPMVPMIFFALLYIIKENRLRSATFITAAIILFLFLSWWEQKTRVGTMMGFYELNKNNPASFYLSNLKWVTPFFVNFMGIEKFFIFFEKYAKLKLPYPELLCWCIFCGVVTLVYLAIRATKKNILAREPSQKVYFLYVSGFCALLLMMLTYLSLRYKPIQNLTWVHLTESRYFSPLVWLCFFWIGLAVSQPKELRFSRWVALFLIPFVFSFLSRGQFYWQVLHGSFPREREVWVGQEKQSEVTEMFQRLPKSSPNHPVLVFDSHSFRTRWLTMQGVWVLRQEDLARANRESMPPHFFWIQGVGSNNTILSGFEARLLYLGKRWSLYQLRRKPVTLG